MVLRPSGSLPALVALTLSALLLALALALVDQGQQAAIFTRKYADVDPSLLAWGGLAYAASVTAAVVSLVLWLVRAPPPLEAPQGDLAPGVALAGMARGFVLRLHRVVLACGGLVAAGGLGLVAAASLYADGTPFGPFAGLPWKVWVVRLSNWQVETTLLAFAQLGLAATFWLGEYRWTRKLRVAWLAPAPEV